MLHCNVKIIMIMWFEFHTTAPNCQPFLCTLRPSLGVGCSMRAALAPKRSIPPRLQVGTCAVPNCLKSHHSRSWQSRSPPLLFFWKRERSLAARACVFLFFFFVYTPDTRPLVQRHNPPWWDNHSQWETLIRGPLSFRACCRHNSMRDRRHPPDHQDPHSPWGGEGRPFQKPLAHNRRPLLIWMSVSRSRCLFLCVFGCVSRWERSAKVMDISIIASVAFGRDLELGCSMRGLCFDARTHSQSSG